jgi:hypothetical protein
VTPDALTELRQKIGEWWAVDAPTAARFSAASDADVVCLFDTWSILRSLFRDQDTVRAFIREPKPPLDGQSVLTLLSAGEFRHANDFVRMLANL